MKQQELTEVGVEVLLNKPATELLNDFGAGRASPGSGSAAALLGILSAKMLCTVCDISSGKDECLSFRKDFAYISEQVRGNYEIRLRELFEKDARDFDQVVALRVNRDSATDTNEKAKFSRDSLDLLQTATDYTFEIAEISLKLMEFGVSIFDNGWHAVRGDSGVAISGAMSSVMSSIFIINLNLKTLKRRKYAKDNLKRCQKIQSQLEILQTKAFSCVTSISSESVKSIQLDMISPTD
ncbi:cyclodeaminase/cyclohydrolase family protein [Ningiella sp. W23]|uniref:cyclodeaminase/cyclohydrolase family protein n=1 Tax=Ningiella sp. W23 TaxID=3023715 RepID=UPI0037570AB1